ncbi:MAG: peptidoglycan DD-metalloendopeptidase family protein [Leptolyngbya sp.]|nr:peptidoglycan DD-metalloendopeptidase family protein [Leptolyngbya sp.]
MLGLALSVGTSGAFLAQTGEVKAADASVVSALTVPQSPQPLASVGSERPTPAEYHTVVTGETVWDIAKLHGVSVEDIKRVNGLGDEPIIKAGQVLKVPTAATVPAAAAVSKATPTVSPSLVAETNVALSSDRTAEVPLSEGVGMAALPEADPTAVMAPVDELAGPTFGFTTPKLNDGADATPSTDLAAISPEASQARSATPETAVVEGDEPLVGRVQAPTLPAPQQVRHRVRAGDTLWSIARQYGIAPSDLIQVNDIRNPNRIFVGTTLVIPNAPQPVATVPTTRESVEFAALEPFRLPGEAPAATPNRASSSVAASPESPAAALTTPPAPDAEAVASVEADPYVANLLARVEGVQAEAAADSTPATDSSVPSASTIELASTENASALTVAAGHGELERVSSLNSTPVNPQFLPDGDDGGVALPSTVDEQELLAAAPLGSEVYAPMTESPTGRVVSPDMPILPESGEYLPEAPNRFDGYRWPAQGVLTSGYGWRWGRMHQGIDIAGPVGTPILAAAPGVVVRSGWNSGGYGNLVDIRHPDGSMTRYAHNSRLLVEVGQQVRGGQQIAEMGSTGFSTGPHLHFEIHLPDQGVVNPVAYLPGR